MANLVKYLITLAVIVNMCYGSAIPMWEYLSRGEKMSHLYSTFAKQVQHYCKTRGDSQPAQCKRELLMYGLGQLHDMDESHLDSMDPYQRGASDIIWDAMMDGHPSYSKKSITTQSAILEPTGQYMRNPIFDEKPISREQIPHKATPIRSSATDKYADMELSIYSDVAYADPQNFIVPEPTNVNVQYVAVPSIQHNSIYSPNKPNYLSGPMVVRVRPDGSPVEEDRKQPLPRDDDRDEMQIGHQKLPTMEQIAEIYKIDSTATMRRGSSHQGAKYSTYSPSGYKNYHIGERVFNLN